MFLAFFPFSEIVYILAGLLAWAYIAIGIFGNPNAAEKEVVSINTIIQQQNTDLHIETLSRFDHSKCFWVNNLDDNSDISAVELKNCEIYYVDFVKINYPNKSDLSFSSCPRNIFSNRAPPFSV